MDADQPAKKTQRRHHDFYNFWRRGEAHIWDAKARKQYYEKIELPKPGGYPGLMSTAYGAQKPPRVFHRIQKSHPRAGAVVKKIAGLKELARVEKQFGSQLKFKRMLGFGGLGMAGLFTTPGPEGKEMELVAKVDINVHEKVIEDEIQNHLRMAGAKHIVQRIILPLPEEKQKGDVGEELARLIRTTEAAGPAAAAEPHPGNRVPTPGVHRTPAIPADSPLPPIDPTTTVLFMEFLRRGSLRDYVVKVSERRQFFPDRVLWQIFNCLFKGVVAMAYPNCWMRPQDNPRKDTLHQYSERVGRMALPKDHDPWWQLVHFDIDPWNVFVGDFDHNEHNIVPIVKIGDLGLATPVDKNLRADNYEMILLRRVGKYTWATPEQFTEEWDYLKDTPEKSKSDTAGNYGYWTNLYQVAMVMWCLVTLCEAEHPPRLELTEILRYDKTVFREFTYGSYVLDQKFEKTSATLRNLIAHCLAHRPCRRPDMKSLEAIMDKEVRYDGPKDMMDYHSKPWSEELFQGPPAPNPIQRATEEMEELHVIFPPMKDDTAA